MVAGTLILFIFSGALLYQDFSGPENLTSSNDTQPVEDTDLQASSSFTDTFESELGPEYVFMIETEEINQIREENGRTYYQASLGFELTEFGERVANASSEQEVEQLVRDSFESYPEEDFASDLMSDVESVQNGRPEEISSEALTGRIENLEGVEGSVVNMEVSVEGNERPEVKFGSFSTVWTMDLSPEVGQSYQFERRFSYGSRSPQAWEVPYGVDQVFVEVEGPGGESGQTIGSTGGSGGFVNATFEVSEGQIYDLYVAGAPSGLAVGWGRVNGNSAGNTDSGSGGGMSAIVRNNVNIVASGGGGGGGPDAAAGADSEIGGLAGGTREAGSNAGGDGSGKTVKTSQIIDFTVEEGGGAPANQNGEIRIYYNRNFPDLGSLRIAGVSGEAQTDEEGVIRTKMSGQ